jgi:uncharacterized protein YbbC (DUF1343 family)
MVATVVVAVAGQPQVRPGLEVLLTDSVHLVAGRRVGLVTNQGGIDRRGTHAVELLRAAGVKLVALFSPEHGFRGSADPGEAVQSSVDSATGLPIQSLYGRTSTPTPAMLAELDLILVDLPDVGARYYTYPSTTIAVMRAAAERGIRVVVLDRPNPIGGTVQGNVLDPAFRSFVGSLAVPMRHGMTLGELARLARHELGLTTDLVVVPTAGWRRQDDLLTTRLPFVPPSPNLRDAESLFHYPGTCLFEGTALSVGRGTDAPYHQIGAPWLDTAAVLGLVRRVKLPGVKFVGVTFTPNRPADGKHAGVAVVGIRLRLTDRVRYDPIRTAVVLLTAIQARHPDRIGFLTANFDRLAGGSALREAIVAGRSADSILNGWTTPRQEFLLRRRAALLYQ